jgi:hypothetical protein
VHLTGPLNAARLSGAISCVRRLNGEKTDVSRTIREVMRKKMVVETVVILLPINQTWLAARQLLLMEYILTNVVSYKQTVFSKGKET